MVELALSKGERVVVTLRKPADVETLQAKYSPSQLLVVRLDVTNPGEILSTFREAKRAFGRVDVVFNNAGMGLFGEVEGTPEATARNIFETNFWGAANVSREAVRFFREENPQGVGGRLLTVSSYAGTAPLPGAGYYSASKAGEPEYLHDAPSNIARISLTRGDWPALEAINQALEGEIDPKWNIKARRASFCIPDSFFSPAHQVSLILLGVVRTPIIYKAEELPLARGYEDPTSPASIGRKLLRATKESTGQSGDVFKTAAKLYEFSTTSNPPLRFVIGLDSISVVGGYLDRLREEMETFKSWSRDLKEERAALGPKL